MIKSTSYRNYHLHVNRSEDNFAATKYPLRYGQQLIHIIEKKWAIFSAHLLLWVSLYFFPLFVSVIQNIHTDIFLSEATNLQRLIPFLLLVALSYINYYRVVPLYYSGKKIIPYLVFCTAGIAALIFVHAIVSAGFGDSSPHGNTWFSNLSYIIALFGVSIFVSIILHQWRHLVSNEKEIIKMKMSSLNAQINPHFLFNSLNWIYLLAIQESAETPGAIVQLSGLMRYLIKDAGANLVDLKKELNYINNYLTLQQGRLGNTVSLNCSIPSYKGPHKIAPLVAMSFIENAFKYGVNPDEDSAINIDISVVGNKFCLQIINNKVPVMNAAGDGVGIENTRQRLNLLYPDRHQLEILDDPKIFSVKLSILMQ